MIRFAFILLLTLWPLQALAADYPARVVGVTDGDTITVLKPDKTPVRVRLAGIDAPSPGRTSARAPSTPPRSWRPART